MEKILSSLYLPASEAIIKICIYHKIAILKLNNNILFIAASIFPEEDILEKISSLCNCKIDVEIFSSSKLDFYLHKQKLNINYLFPILRKNIELKKIILVEFDNLESNDLIKFTSQNYDYNKKEENRSPIINLICFILKEAIKLSVSDIHCEPKKNSYRIRFRIDGTLNEIIELPKSKHNSFSSCIKVMANLDVSEKRLPQDGQFSIEVNEITYPIRVSILNTFYGEKIALRILETKLFLLEKIGLISTHFNKLVEKLALKQGLILITGPTGSGKTTTLYSSLLWLNQYNKNICTIEDPIETTIYGVNQFPINKKIGLDFSVILRSLLRQDPDVIMIGEIRDKETAEIAINAAQTGHLVLSTLHTSSAIDTFLRLLQIGIPLYLLTAAIQLIIAQRLVRQLCHCCKKKASFNLILSKNNKKESLSHWVAVGCQYCHNGYDQRIGIYEYLEITPEMKHIINTYKENIMEIIIKLANIQIKENLLTASLNLIKMGLTSAEEIEKIFGIFYSMESNI